MTTYVPGWFSEPVRKWPGLQDYVPKLYDLLMAGKYGTAARSQIACATRQRMLESDDPQKQWAGQGSIAGLGKPLYEEKKSSAWLHGTPCPKCRGTLRYINGGSCVTCTKARVHAR